ncbi:biotin--[acetyl-CoA-carboxylase] ligase [Leucobacter viscericola]|uniref:biotin--[biotin carboxyl-carrier protein] ligase n=1 Tax=Leucobacter viscericola TaxID=2714935 RepID=A0A6G7XH61_9MICO|nr:biotin--[acetyl-CoA-carboxylase] ligase [Leucobacter viscericola]QIK63883.1 biotin--[acetyl-CoA-carboxylase] ligase [Leucobacter viscericola]
MELTRTRAILPQVIWHRAVPSTNAALRELALQGEDRAPHGTLVATADQTAGKGRLGREWVMPADTAVAASLLIRGFGKSGLPASWLPLLAGSAVVGALQPLFGEGMRVGVKWPNDVHVRTEADAEEGRVGQKLCGILCEMLPDGSVVVGMGINLLIPEWELPTDRATSLLAAGADVRGAELLTDAAGQDLLDRVLHDVCAGLLRLVELANVDPQAARNRVARHSLTLGTEVRVHLPGDEIVDGRARALADDGSLVVDLPTGGELTVSAGDVEHLR